MKELFHIAIKLLMWALGILAAVFLAALLSSKGMISPKAAATFILSIPFLLCLGKTIFCMILRNRGLPATGFLSYESRIAHLRYTSADGVVHKGSCDLLTRRALKKGSTVPIWYDPLHPNWFTAGQREILLNGLFCIVFASVPAYYLFQ